MFGSKDTPAPPLDVPGDGQLKARFVTSEGEIVCDLHESETPRTVANFVALATGTVEWTRPDSRPRRSRPSGTLECSTSVLIGSPTLAAGPAPV